MPRIVNGACRSPGHHIRMLAGSVAIATLVCASGTLALAEDATIKSMSFSTETPYKKNTVSVTSATGAKWDTILPGTVEFWASMQVDTKWPGYVQDAGIFLGSCVDTQCGEGSPLVYYESVMRRDYVNAQYVSFSTAKLQVSSIIPAPVPYGDEILRRCNQELQPDGATKPHSFDMPIVVAFTVNTRKDAGNLGPAEVGSADDVAWGGGDETRHAQFLAHVECLAHSKSAADPNPDPHRNKTTVLDLDLFLATAAAPDPSPRTPAGARCKPVVVTTRIATDKAGPVTVKQWRQVNGGPITSETRQMSATALGGGKFGDDWVKLEHFTQTTIVQYKDEVMGGTFAPSTSWKSITIHCNGNYAAPTTNANPDNGLPAPGGQSQPDKRRKAEEKAREREPNSRPIRESEIRPRPLIDNMVVVRPLDRRPPLGTGHSTNPRAGLVRRAPLVR